MYDFLFAKGANVRWPNAHSAVTTTDSPCFSWTGIVGKVNRSNITFGNLASALLWPFISRQLASSLNIRGNDITSETLSGSITTFKGFNLPVHLSMQSEFPSTDCYSVPNRFLRGYISLQERVAYLWYTIIFSQSMDRIAENDTIVQISYPFLESNIF